MNVDAIIFWFVHDAQKAALNITNYRQAIDQASQTSLREMIGSSMLSALLSERTAADELLRGEIGRKTADWGISVKSVEIRDVAIPVALQDAMSRQAQAEREKQARVILGSAEAAIAGKFVEAAMTYADHPAALQLRAMNIIYETTKERGATILIPTSMVDSMNPGVALALAGQETAPQKANGPLSPNKIAPLANLSEDVSLAARNATLNMIDFLVKEKGLTREQAYTVVSVAVDLNIAQLVDVPNLGVTAILNRDIFKP